MRIDEINDSVVDTQFHIAIKELGLQATNELFESTGPTPVLDNLYEAWGNTKLSNDDVGSRFMPVGIMAIPGHKWINISAFTVDAILVSIGKMARFEDLNGKTASFPNNNDTAIKSLFLKDTNEYHMFLTDITVRLSDWTITYKDLSE